MSVKSPDQWIAEFDRLFTLGEKAQIDDLYTPDATFIPERGKVLRGHAELRDTIGFFMDMSGKFRFKVRGVTEGSDIALLYTTWIFDAPDREEPVHMGGDATIVLAKQADGTWKAKIDDGYSFWLQDGYTGF